MSVASLLVAVSAALSGSGSDDPVAEALVELRSSPGLAYERAKRGGVEVWSSPTTRSPRSERRYLGYIGVRMMRGLDRAELVELISRRSSEMLAEKISNETNGNKDRGAGRGSRDQRLD
jgi:hypothetical protein